MNANPQWLINGPSSPGGGVKSGDNLPAELDSRSYYRRVSIPKVSRQTLRGVS
jgi:hypothetical protein